MLGGLELNLIALKYKITHKEYNESPKNLKNKRR